MLIIIWLHYYQVYYDANITGTLCNKNKRKSKLSNKIKSTLKKIGKNAKRKENVCKLQNKTKEDIRKDVLKFLTEGVILSNILFRRPVPNPLVGYGKVYNSYVRERG